MSRARASAGAIGATAAALAAGAVIPMLPRRFRPIGSAVSVAAGLAAAHWGGADATTLGLARADARRGAIVGMATGATLAAGVVGAAVHPRTRHLFADGRVTSTDSAHSAFEVLVRIPFATALAEELLFRGAVLGAWQRAAGAPTAVAVSSLAFGAWHVIPALESHTHNPAGARLSDAAGGRATHVGATVLATAVAGAGFAALRLRSRSVLASVIAHAAVNEAAFLAARWAHAPRPTRAHAPRTARAHAPRPT